MNIIIVADKFQKRMKSKGCVGLIKDNKNKTILEKQYATIKNAFGSVNIAYVYGFDCKRFESFFTKNKHNLSEINPIYNSHYETYNTICSIDEAKEFLQDECVILFGDTSLSKQTFKRFDPTIGSQLFLSDNSHSTLGCILDGNNVQNISYQLDNTLSEIYYLCKEDASALKQIIETKKFHQYFLFELINKLIDNKHIIYSYKHK